MSRLARYADEPAGGCKTGVEGTGKCACSTARGICRWFFLAVFCVGINADALAGSAEVRLAVAATTSAGIYDSSGRLVRTLWGGRQTPKGVLRVQWDGNDDEGSPLAASAAYSLKVLAHQVRYRWEGVIGNTSTAMAGPAVHRSLGAIQDMAITDTGEAFYVVGYNEQQSAIRKFSVTAPQSPATLAHDDYRRVFSLAATDGNLAYFANVGLSGDRATGYHDPDTFIVALRVRDGAEHVFAAGHGIGADHPQRQWRSAIDHDVDDREVASGFFSAASGIAVQRQGSRLFVAHRNLDEIRVFHKTSGLPLERIPLRLPGVLRIAGDDSLWAIGGEEGSRALYHYVSRGGAWVQDARVALSDWQPVALGVSPRDATLLVIDGATDQLVRLDSSGRRLQSWGMPHGCQQRSPEVRIDALCFAKGPRYIAFAPDGSFWVGDPANARNLHMSAAFDLLEQIAYLPKTYVITTDTANPRRVFAHFLEFEVDYGKPLATGWRLVRNWGQGISTRYRGEFDGFVSVCTLADGRTWGVIRRYDTNDKEVVELTENGIRPTGVRLDWNEKMYPDGSRRTGKIGLGRLQVAARPYEGVNSIGTPTWGMPMTLAQIGSLKPDDPYFHDVPLVATMNEATYPLTDSGLLVTFNPGKSAGYHLGAVELGGSAWRWRASPSGSWRIDATGTPAETEGSYELDHGAQYLGNVVVTAARQVIYGYHGEGWNGGEANQWLHFTEDGLFVGQFGHPAYPDENRAGAPAATAGNAFSSQLVQIGDTLYLWHNDEAAHAGVHRWRIDGIKSMQVLTAPITP